MFWKKKPQIQEPEQKRNLVCIDGDLFRLELPTNLFWDELSEFAKVTGLEFRKKFAYVECLLQDSLNERVFLSTAFQKPMPSDEESKKKHPPVGYFIKVHAGQSEWKIQSTSELSFGFQPVLIPLFSDLSFAVESDADNNPNGTITCGGTLYINDNPIKGGPPAIYNPEQMNIHIGDTCSGHELKWVHWNGCMIATDLLFYVNPIHVLDFIWTPGERI